MSIADELTTIRMQVLQEIQSDIPELIHDDEITVAMLSETSGLWWHSAKNILENLVKSGKYQKFNRKTNLGKNTVAYKKITN